MFGKHVSFEMRVHTHWRARCVLMLHSTTKDKELDGKSSITAKRQCLEGIKQVLAPSLFLGFTLFMMLIQRRSHAKAAPTATGTRTMIGFSLEVQIDMI